MLSDLIYFTSYCPNCCRFDSNVKSVASQFVGGNKESSSSHVNVIDRIWKLDEQVKFEAYIEFTNILR